MVLLDNFSSALSANKQAGYNFNYGTMHVTPATIAAQ
jgi:hypothetical protein